MAKPVSVVSWATTGGTRLEPTAPEKAAGWSAGERPPAKWFNFLFGLLGDWTTYLNNLHNDGDFLGQAYTWTAAHVFSQTVTLGSSALVVYGTPPARVSFAELHKACLPETSDKPVFNADGQAISPATGTPGTIRVPFRVPSGATISQIRADVFLGSSADVTMTCRRKTASIGGSNTSTAVGLPVTLSAVSGQQTVTRGGLSDTASSATEYWVDFEFSSHTGSETVNALEVSWTDPGPKGQVT